jgi:uncharacterized coiled-coil protein SlyX
MTTSISRYRWSMSSEQPQPHGFWAWCVWIGAAIGFLWRGAFVIITAATTGMKRLSALEIRVDDKEREIAALNIQISGLETTIAELRRKDAEQQGEIDQLTSQLKIAKSERDDAMAQLAKLNHPQ